MDKKDLIDDAKNSFDPELHTETYRAIHSDAEHLARLLGMFELRDYGAYLDIGTGNGYVAFALAKLSAKINVMGIDIAENSIGMNNKIRQQEKISNICFEAFDGLKLKFEEKSVHGSIARYSFHHFPDANGMLDEIHRILESGGFFILSDPIMFEEDSAGFIDSFQMLKKDGHVHFYTHKEICGMFARHGFSVEKEFYSSIRYPREFGAAYEKLLQRTPEKIRDKYKIGVENDRVFVEVSVANIFFRKLAK
jgi:SAM-dependent methyltransferase